MNRVARPSAVLALLALLLVRGPGADLAGGQAAPAPDGPTSSRAALADLAWLGDALAPEPVAVDATPADLTGDGLRLALPPGRTPAELGLDPAAAVTPAQDGSEWRVDDGQAALRITLNAGADHGLANRFDPADFWDAEDPAARVPPRALRVRKIYFAVNAQGEPTGPMEWHIWEDNGGHKADPTADIVAPFVVNGGPGVNVIDLEAMGIEAVIDPPRMFQVGVAGKESEATSPDVLLDDGLPYVGGTGDFHASTTGAALGANPAQMYCGMEQWIILSVSMGGNDVRSPAWMIWLEVEWLSAPDETYFAAADGGDFARGSRIAWGDYDGDGLEDILSGGRTLYRNRGDGTFEDVTAAAGITDTGAGGVWADYDNDGDLDFYQYTGNCVPCGREDNFDDLWRNRGDGTFESVREIDYGGDPAAPVPRDPLPSEAATWGDFNGDGLLDLYVANHVDWDTGTCFDDYLWLNEGPPGFGFRDASVESGIRFVTLCGRGVNAADFDDDGDLDIFVSNYRLNPDLLWANTGTGEDGTPHFVDEAFPRGVAGVTKRGQFFGSFGHTIGSAWGDLDRDGDLDLAAGRLAHSAWLCFSDPTMLYASSGAEGGHTFVDHRAAAGVKYNEVHSDASLVDFDNDGRLDLHLTHVYDGWRSSTYRNLGPPTVPTLYLPAAARGAPPEDGGWVTGPAAAPRAKVSADLAARLGLPPFSFEDVTAASGIWPRSSWGSGWADLDLDGDMDLAARGLWRNTASESRPENHWLQVAAHGCGPSNRDAIGTRLRVVGDGTSGNAAQVAEIVSARGTGSQDSRVSHFGLGPGLGVVAVDVTFPSGQVQSLGDVPVDQRITVVEVGAYLHVAPGGWTALQAQPVELVADTCGAEREVAWDLDGDGQFDDGSGARLATTFTELGPRDVAARVAGAGITEVARATILVEAGPETP